MSGKKVHHGRNVKRLREMSGVKQETLASELNMSQQNVSVLESKEEIEAGLIEQIAKVLNIPTEAIRSFDGMAAVNMNTFHDFKDNSAAYNPTDMELIRLRKDIFRPDIEKLTLFTRMLRTNALYKKAKISHK